MMDDIVGLIPAAGFATRLGQLPCSKELLPAGWRPGEPVDERKPLIAYLLERLAEGSVERAVVVTREEKRDIPLHLGDGSRWGIALEYLFTGPTRSSVETLDVAYDRVRGHRVALGYPDILFTPSDAYAQLDRRHRETGATISLGLFPSTQPEKSDMVQLTDDGAVDRLVIKQPDRGLRHTWSIALWTPEFTEHLHDHLAHSARGSSSELYVGDVIQSAIDQGTSASTAIFDDGASTDLGTPEALADPPSWFRELPEIPPV